MKEERRRKIEYPKFYHAAIVISICFFGFIITLIVLIKELLV